MSNKQMYTIRLVAEAGNNPITGKPQPEQIEFVTVEAESVEKACQRTQYVMKMRLQGQLLRYFHEGTEIFWG